ncbi:hypothetical protein PRVXT_001625 [Proteinivorax tanatarense]|uniref:WYL domain-containing protein n=1 Tax=Proteinivorax tanatarense TaxID=1260629 RepID=A0AAU7VHE0_9FIRM
MIDQVIDCFGEGVKITPIDKNYFRVHVNSSINSMKFWLLQYITAIDEIYPEKLNSIIVKYLEDALKRNRR